MKRDLADAVAYIIVGAVLIYFGIACAIFLGGS